MIISMRGCIAYNYFWHWPLFSRSFGLGPENRVHSVAAAVPGGFFPYLVQMITSMRRCVACDDLCPWPISSGSFDLDFEKSVCSITFSVLDRLFPYLPQIITTIRGCVACYVYNKIIKFINFLLIFLILQLLPWKNPTILLAFIPYLAHIIISIKGCVACNDLWPWPIFLRSFGLDLENRVHSVASSVLDGFFPYLVQMIASMRWCVACDYLWPWPISSRSFDLVLTWDPAWLNSVDKIMRQRGVSSERRRSSCSNYSRWSWVAPAATTRAWTVDCDNSFGCTWHHKKQYARQVW